MNRAITIVINAKNAMGKELASCGASLKQFGQTAWSWGKKAALGIAGATVAVAAFAGKALKSFAEAEAAENAMRVSLSAYGEEVEKNLAVAKERSSAIQDATGIDADATLSNMARLRMLGLETSALDRAAKAVIGLTAQGMGQEQAVKAVAQAHAGHFTSLQKLIPALRTATSETEKARLVNDFMAKGYDLAKSKMGTVGGAWAALKERISDVWEETGKALSQNGTLVALLQKAGDAVKAFGIRLAEWAEGGGVAKLIAGVLSFAENARHSWAEIRLAFDVMSSWIADAWGTTANYLGGVLSAIKGNYVAVFGYIRDFAVAVFEKIKHPFSEFKPPSIRPILDAAKNYVKAIAGANAKVTTNMDETNRKIDEETLRHANRQIEIEKWKTDQLANEGKKQVEGAKTTAADIGVAQENYSKTYAAAEKKRTEIAKKGQAEIAKMSKAYWDDQLAKVRELIAAQAELAKRRVQDLINEKKAKDALDKGLAADQKKADRLAAREARGAKLSDKDKEFLEAAKKIRDAQQGKGVPQALKDAKDAAAGKGPAAAALKEAVRKAGGDPLDAMNALLAKDGPIAAGIVAAIKKGVGEDPLKAVTDLLRDYNVEAAKSAEAAKHMTAAQQAVATKIDLTNELLQDNLQTGED